MTAVGGRDSCPQDFIIRYFIRSYSFSHDRVILIMRGDGMIGPCGITFLLAISSIVSFFAGHMWGREIISNFKGPLDVGFIFPGQRWRVPGVGDVIIYDVWPETVSYYLAKRKSDVEKMVYTMNRADFEEGARDESGRDGRGRLRTPEDKKVIKFEIMRGGKD